MQRNPQYCSVHLLPIDVMLARLVLLLACALVPLSADALGRYDARNADECRAQVNANFDALQGQMRAQGNQRGIQVTEERGRQEYLHDCDQLERFQQDRRMTSAYRRLGGVMDQLIAGDKPSAEGLAAVADDARVIRSFKPAPYRDAYAKRHADFERLLERGPSPEQRAAPRLAPPPEPPAPNPELGTPTHVVGRLRPWGAYLGAESGQSVSVLANGAVLLFGRGRPRPDADDPAVLANELRRRHDAPPVSGVEVAPRLWDPLRRGWRRLAQVPECPMAARTLHTATVLADDRVLFAGGLCDEGRMANDTTPRLAFGAMSLWDGKAGRWAAAPALQHPRIDHGASLLSDGSVLFTGGRSDPALAATGSEPVLATAERYDHGRMVPVPPLQAARAGHTATVLADGSTWVVGGFDAQGRAMASVERWAPGDAAWRAGSAVHFARHGHSATLLADGRVLVVGGVGIDGQRLTAVELWDPGTQAWRAAPSLPVPLAGHAATRLADGRVLVAGNVRLRAIDNVPWAWVWGPGESEWQVAGLVDQGVVRTHAEPVTLVPRTDGGALVFTDRTILRWQPQTPSAASTPPSWRAAPAAALLADGRVLFVGLGVADFGSSQSAYLWDPASDRWQAAGRLTAGVRLHARLLALPSGRALYVAQDGEGRFTCDGWSAADPGWGSCGSAAIEYLTDHEFETGLLPDGRALVLVNRHEALVFDEPRQAWSTWKPEWNTEGLSYGAPVRTPQPLARVRDPAGEHWTEINDVAARWWGRQVQGSGLRLLWDAQGQRWAYVLRDTIGYDARRLPDGCSLSLTPPALFDPASDQAVPLPDPGLGMPPGQRAMLLLPDGTVVVAGVPEFATDPGSGFFRRKASCQGFAADPDRADFITGNLAVDPIPSVAPKAAATAVPWQRQAVDGVVEHRWLLLAVGAPLLGWLLLRRTRLTRVQLGPAWVLRSLVYGAALLWLVPTAWSYLGFSATRKAQACAEDPDCRPNRATAKGALPCTLIGLWSSQQGKAMRRIEFKDDGSYLMAPSHTPGLDPAAGYRGRWWVEGQTLVWQHMGVAELDVNPMQPDGADRFTLVEANGSQTRFERIRAVPSQRCTS